MRWILAAALVAGAVAPAAAGDELGPYRLRSGRDATHMHWEYWVKVEEDKEAVALRYCATLVRKGVEASKHCPTKPLEFAADRSKDGGWRWIRGGAPMTLSADGKQIVLGDPPWAYAELGETPWEEMKIYE